MTCAFRPTPRAAADRDAIADYTIDKWGPVAFSKASAIKGLNPECGCDVSGGLDFCQHCVAVGLHLQDRQKTAKPTDKRSALRQIRRHLSALSKDELLDQFLDVISHDRVLRDDLLQTVRLSSEAMSYSELKRMIDAVEADKPLDEPREIRAYFKGLAAMLVRLGEYAATLDPLVLLRSTEYAVRRFNADVTMIDWVEDFGESSMDLLIDLHQTAVRRLGWNNAELASYLVDRGTTESWHPFSALAVSYCEDLGDSFHEAVVAEIEKRRDALAGSGRARTDEDPKHEYLEDLMDSLGPVAT